MSIFNPSLHTSESGTSITKKRQTSWPIECKVPGCTSQVNLKKRRLCWKHYHQDKKGKIGQTREIEYHGMTGTPEFNTWGHVVQRCTNPNNKAYKNYGKRGITICQRYRYSFAAFYGDLGSRPQDTTLNRIDNDGGYWCGKCDECITKGRPANCEWATSYEQQVNKRVYTSNTSGHKNIVWNKRAQLWVLVIQRKNKIIYSGYFDVLNDAVSIREAVLEEYERLGSIEPNAYIRIGKDKRRAWNGLSAERNPAAKLTWEKVRRIRELWLEGGLYQHEIADMVGASHGVVSGIVRNLSWRDDDYQAKVTVRGKWDSIRMKKRIS